MRLFTTRRAWTAEAVKQVRAHQAKAADQAAMADMEDLFGSEAESEAERKGAADGELRGWAHGASGCFPAGGAAPGNVMPPRSCPAPPACPAVPASPWRRAPILRLEGQGPAWARGGVDGRTCGLRPSVYTWPIEGVTVNKWRSVQLPIGRHNARCERAS